MAEICADKEVMEYFPFTLSRVKTAELIVKRQRIFAENGFCYYAVEIIESKELIGFIGIICVPYFTIIVFLTMVMV